MSAKPPLTIIGKVTQAPQLQIWILSDGKPGHENQSLGLVEAMARSTPCQFHKINLPKRKLLIDPLIREQKLPPPDLLVAAGHSTHLPLLWLARRYNAPCVVLMKPSIPANWFDLCLVPRHDLKDSSSVGDTIEPTHGALNRVAPAENTSRQGGLFLIGGPSKAHGWETRTTIESLKEILGSSPIRPWSLTDSRRTPDDFIVALAPLAGDLAIFPHQKTGPEWLPARLAQAEEVWVTEDSVSMIYEALTSGARVGLLPVPQLKKDSRVNRGIELLAKEGYVTRFTDWQNTRQLRPAPDRLQEAQRCATIVLERFFS